MCLHISSVVIRKWQWIVHDWISSIGQNVKHFYFRLNLQLATSAAMDTVESSCKVQFHADINFHIHLVAIKFFHFSINLEAIIIFERTSSNFTNYHDYPNIQFCRVLCSVSLDDKLNLAELKRTMREGWNNGQCKYLLPIQWWVHTCKITLSETRDVCETLPPPLPIHMRK